MKFVPSNNQDISKYFRGTYIKFKEFGDMLFNINYVDSYEVKGVTEEGREFRLFLSENHPYEVDYILPHKSFFQFEDKACMLQRIPQRQYQRGLSMSNTGMNYLGEDDTPKGLRVDFTTLKAFVSKQKFFTLSEALKSQNKSCVLSKRMMFRPVNNTIYIDFIPIAKVVGKDIKMIRPLFKEEIKAFLLETMEANLWEIK